MPSVPANTDSTQPLARIMDEKVRSKIKDQLRRLVIASSDLMRARRYAMFLVENNLLPASNSEEQLRRYAFQTSLVVTYTRQFQDSRGGDSTVPDTLFGRHLRVLDRRQKELHDRLLDLRNTIYAHSDGDEFDVSFEKVQIEELDISWVWPESRNPYAPFNESELKEIIEMVDEVRNSISQHREELEEKLFPEEST